MAIVQVEIARQRRTASNCVKAVDGRRRAAREIARDAVVVAVAGNERGIGIKERKAERAPPQWARERNVERIEQTYLVELVCGAGAYEQRVLDGLAGWRFRNTADQIHEIVETDGVNDLAREQSAPGLCQFRIGCRKRRHQLANGQLQGREQFGVAPVILVVLVTADLQCGVRRRDTWASQIDHQLVERSGAEIERSGQRSSKGGCFAVAESVKECSPETNDAVDAASRRMKFERASKAGSALRARPQARRYDHRPESQVQLFSAVQLGRGNYVASAWSVQRAEAFAPFYSPAARRIDELWRTRPNEMHTGHGRLDNRDRSREDIRHALCGPKDNRHYYSDKSDCT